MYQLKYEYCGYSVSIDGSGDTIAIATRNETHITESTNYYRSGTVRVYTLSNETWIQKGKTLSCKDNGGIDNVVISNNERIV